MFRIRNDELCGKYVYCVVNNLPENWIITDYSFGRYEILCRIFYFYAKWLDTHEMRVFNYHEKMRTISFRTIAR